MIMGYLDDMVLLGRLKQQLREDVCKAAKLFQDLGFMISVKKSMLEPS